jgi:glycosyltransferase involved in cell wall biosynthesis
MPSDCTAPGPRLRPMVLLIGNFLPDQQQSMQRFAEMMLRELRVLAVPVKLIRPTPCLTRFIQKPSSLAKWAGYFDKFALFPRQVHASADIVHICDHSNVVYSKYFSRTPVVVTCHDLIAVRSALGENTDCPVSFAGRILQRAILGGLQRADAIACVSQATAADARRLLGPRAAKVPSIRVIENGLSYEYKPLLAQTARARLAAIPRLALDRPFVIHVGSNLPRKNRAGVLRIFARTKERWNAQLVFAGDRLSDQLAAKATALGIADRIIDVGPASSELLEALYNCAHALLFPSTFEGFGWPIAEAQACGCPVVTTESPPMSEVVGEAGLLRDAKDEEGFAQDLLSLCDAAAREKIRELSLLHAGRFSARKMAEQYLALYRELGAAA